MENLISYYDNFYSQTLHPFGNQPSEILSRALKYLAEGNALDCGAGDGRNTLFLAEHGFTVDAIDFSSVACSQLQNRANKKKLPIITITEDIRKHVFQKKYNLILMAFVLHHLTQKDAQSFVQKVQKFTEPNGINVIAAQTVNGDFFRTNPNTDSFFDIDEQLKKMYADWDILEYYKEDRMAAIKKTNGLPFINECIFMIARKKPSNTTLI